MKQTEYLGIRSIRQAGVNLRALRKARNMTQKQLSDATGTAQSSISDIETGYVSVSLDVYLRLLEALDAELFAGERRKNGIHSSNS